MNSIHSTAVLSRKNLHFYAALLWFLTFLFFLRVLGQVLVAFFDTPLLPPMEQWYSGLIPYSILLTRQCLILIVQIKIDNDFSKGQGFFVVPRRKLGRFLCWFSTLYFVAMALRYLVTMAIYPELRWFGGTIPIFFHFVLAGYLFVWGRFYTTRDRHPIL